MISIQGGANYGQKGFLKAKEHTCSFITTHWTRISSIAIYIIFICIFIISANESAYAYQPTDNLSGAGQSITQGFSKLLSFIFGPIRWIVSIAGVTYGLFQIFGGSRPDSRRLGMWVIAGVVAYSFIPSITNFIFSIKDTQRINDYTTLDAPTRK